MLNDYFYLRRSETKNTAKGIEAEILFASKCKKIAAKSPTLAPNESFY
jgi:hypothetical protein